MDLSNYIFKGILVTIFLFLVWSMLSPHPKRTRGTKPPKVRDIPPAPYKLEPPE